MRLLMIVLASIFSLQFTIAQDLAMEESGQDSTTPENVFPNPASRALAMQRLQEGGLILIPESSNDRVMAFDPMSGDLIDPDFIPSDPDNLSTPICAIRGFSTDTILVSDQIDDVIQMYNVDGTYLGIFAPAGGPDTSILDNIRGIAISSHGTLLVSVGGGSNADAIAEFDSTGTYIGNFVANGSGGLDSPFDVLERTIDFLVAGITSDLIHRYDSNGAYLDDFPTDLGFPEQVTETASGNILVGNFSSPNEGVVELTSSGVLVDVYDPASLGGYRGAYELQNGNILTTNGDGVHEIDRSGNLVETKISGVSARFIEYLGPTNPVPTMGRWGLFLFCALLMTLSLVVLRKK